MGAGAARDPCRMARKFEFVATGTCSCLDLGNWLTLARKFNLFPSRGQPIPSQRQPISEPAAGPISEPASTNFRANVNTLNFRARGLCSSQLATKFNQFPSQSARTRRRRCVRPRHRRRRRRRRRQRRSRQQPAACETLGKHTIHQARKSCNPAAGSDIRRLGARKCVDPAAGWL